MFGSPVFEVLIALGFLYLLLSLVCSALNELVSQLIGLRYKTLVKGVERLLTDPTRRQQVMQHPLLKALGDKPSYIPSETFALALFENLVPADRMVEAPDPNNPGQMIRKMADGTTFDDLRGALTRLPDEDLRRSLLTLVDSTDTSMEEARAAVEKWFNNSMDRVSGWYKRESQHILLVLALVVTVVINADTLELADSLWKDSGLRESVVAAAEGYAQGYKASGTTPEGDALANPEEVLGEIQGLLTEDLELPLGWTKMPENSWAWVMKIAGLLLTALAVSLGAPFWFDLLNRIVSLRGSGKVPDKK